MDVKSTSGAGLLSVIVSAVAGILAFVLFLIKKARQETHIDNLKNKL